MRPKHLRAYACMTAAAVIGLSAHAYAQSKAGDPDDPMNLGVAYEHVAFDAADSNGDGIVDEAEFARDAAAGFAGLDRNHDGKLTPAELGPHDPKQFARVDANGDGVLTFPEVMTFKMKAFKAADKNGDGGLSFEEMSESVRSSQ